ncbi:hypothetical protein H2198_001979 [Neophaeococcomyces mojaviensis]|uniref:Uncharacterized protein n=1 Tax=Neophaeococcomyces mojaviensis TaxID=3383035 RepID=A0ACC3AFP9_9EURO|nr:hypothetical protein H2198_001979 [Knufia sp. JES_112]
MLANVQQIREDHANITARDTTETIVEIESEIGGIGGIGEIVGIETEIESAEEAGRPITDRDETTRIRIPRAETTGPENEKIVTAIDATNENGTETEHLAGGMMGDRLDEIAIFSTTEEAEERGLREDRDEFAAQARGAKTNSPPPKKREPTPDLTDVTPVLERKRRLTQWDIKPPGYENVTAEQAKLSGMFPLPGAPRQQMDASKLQAFINQPTNIDKSALKPSTARQSKRLFLYNIPATATDESIINWFNLHLNGLNVTKSTDPCAQSNLASDRSFALVEFKTPEDATVALSLDGETMEEHVAEANGNAADGVKGLDIKRPKDYIVPSPDPEAYNALGKDGMSTEVPDSENKVCVSNLPTFLNEDQATELVESFGKLRAFTMVKDNGTEDSRGICFFEYADASSTAIAVEGLNGMDIAEHKLKASPASIGYKQASDMEMGVNAMSMFAGAQSNDFDEGRVLQLLNMVTPEELIDNDEYEEICEDITEECSKYGQILDMKIPRPAGGSRQSAGVGKIYIKYADAAAAKKALQALAGRKFADRTVVTTYFDEASFEVNAW